LGFITEETVLIKSGRLLGPAKIVQKPEPFKENVAITRRVVEKAQAKGISVEAELGRLGGVEEDVKVDEGSAFLTSRVLSRSSSGI
jgi:Fructose-bisphosphate aldolase class-II